MKLLEWNDKLAVAISRTQLNDPKFMSDLNMHCIKENKIYDYSLKVLASKDFFFLNDLNEFIQRSVDSGLIVKWLEGNQLRTFTTKAHSLEYAEVNSKSLTAFIFVLIFILIIVLLVAITEIIAYKKVQTPNSAAIWQHIEMIINPDRYFLLQDLDYILI